MMSQRVCDRSVIEILSGTPATGVIPAGGVIVIPTGAGASPRLASYLTLFDNYKVNSLRFTFEPSLGLNVNGQYIMYWEPDVAVVIPTTIALAGQGQAGAVNRAIRTRGTLAVSRAQLTRLPQYQINATALAESPGSLMFVYSPIGGLTGTAAVEIGRIWMEIDLQLINPSYSS